MYDVKNWPSIRSEEEMKEGFKKILESYFLYELCKEYIRLEQILLEEIPLIFKVSICVILMLLIKYLN